MSARRKAALAKATEPTGLNLAGLESALGFRLRIFEQVILRSFARHMDPLSLTPTLYSILVLVRDNPMCRQIDLSQALLMHQPNLADRVASLVERGLIAREIDPRDRRANVLAITPSGRRFMEKVAVAHEAHLSEVRALLGPGRYDAILELVPPAS